MKGVVIQTIKVNGKQCKGLIDTGCSRTIVSPKINIKPETIVAHSRGKILSFNGQEVPHDGEADVAIEMAGRKVIVRAIMCARVLEGTDVIVGMDVLSQYVVTINRGQLNVAAVATSPEEHRIVDKRFEVVFNGKAWIARWQWTAEPQVTKKISAYRVPKELRGRFNDGVRRWIAEGWLVPREGTAETEEKGLIPLMVVEQITKGKARPVMDYREVNQFVSSSGANADVCGDKLREWRQMPENCAILDLKDAYMQIHAHPSCSKFQRVRFEGRNYELTRVGFGLACAPQILKAVVQYVLGLDERIQRACNACYDDILVDLNQVSAERVADHLKRYGLIVKPPKKLGDGAALGLAVKRVHRRLEWGRPMPVDAEITPKTTKRELFSMCGKLTSHFPVCGWLRAAASFAKRACEADKWDAPLNESAVKFAKELVDRVKREDPARGVWHVKSKGHFRIWCDASSVAVAAALECDGEIVEDGSWLRKRKDPLHINFAELVSVMRGVTLAMRWGVKQLEIMTDSASVYWWLQSLATGDQRLCVSGDGEMLIRRRLELIAATLKEYGVEWSVRLVPSKENKADALSRVPQTWPKADVAAIATADSARQAHADAHAGVEPTLRVAQKINPAATRAEVKQVVRECVPCGEYDPSPVKMQRGSLKVDKVWDRLACDVTHVGQEKFVTIVDCGPSRFAVWQRVNHEDDTEVAACLRKVFEWYSAPKELLMDNGRAFRSKKVEELCNKWAVNRLFGAAYKPRGNGIVERNHRSVKRVKARRGGTVEEAVRVYNGTPRGPLYAVPAEVMFGRSVMNPIVRRARVSEDHPGRVGENRHTSEGSRQYREGDRVVVKPPNARCDTRLSGGTVTKVNSPWNVEVNGVPRHIQDVRLARSGTNEQEAAPRVPQPGIVLDDGPDDPGDRDQQPDEGIEEQSSIPSDSWEDASSNRTDETLWRSLPFQDEDAFSDQSEEPVAERAQVPEVQERNAAEVEEATVRRSTRTRKIPERYGDWVEDPSDD